MAAQLVGSTLVQRGRSWRDGLAKRNHAYLVPDFGLQQLRDAGPRPKDPLWRSSEKRFAGLLGCCHCLRLPSIRDVPTTVPIG